MEGQSEEYQRGHSAGKQFVLGIHEKANAMRGKLFCVLGNDALTRQRELTQQLSQGDDPAAVAARALVWVEWLGKFIVERGLTMCSAEHLPQA